MLGLLSGLWNICHSTTAYMLFDPPCMCTCLMVAASKSDSPLAQRNSICHQVWRVCDCKGQVDWGSIAVSIHCLTSHCRLWLFVSVEYTTQKLWLLMQLRGKVLAIRGSMLCLKYSILQVTMSALFAMWLKLCPSVNSWYIEMLLSWRTYRNSTVSTWLLATWLGTVAKMNCMNYLTFCNFSFRP